MSRISKTIPLKKRRIEAIDALYDPRSLIIDNNPGEKLKKRQTQIRLFRSNPGQVILSFLSISPSAGIILICLLSPGSPR